MAVFFNSIPTDASATIGIATLVLFPAWVSYWFSSKDLKKINTAFIEMPAQIAAVLEKVDYFYLGIGVDVDNKMLANNSIDRKYRISEPFKFSLDKVINYQAFSPGHTVISGTGLNSDQQAQQARQDFSRKLKWIHPILAAKNDLAINACGGPGRPASLVVYPTRGRQLRSRNDWTRCRKACIFTTLKLRENTCTIATGD